MRLTLSKISALLLMSIAAVPFVCIVLLIAMQHINYFSIKERLEAEKLTTIYLTSAQMNASDNKNELLINGRMFDVKSITLKTSGCYELTGLFDDEEQAICNNLQKLGSNNAAGKSQKTLKFIFAFSAIIPEINKLIADPLWINKKKDTNYYAQCRMVHCPVLSPPPKA